MIPKFPASFQGIPEDSGLCSLSPPVSLLLPNANISVGITDHVSLSSERSGYMGGVLGIDVASHRHHALENQEERPVARVGGKIQVLKREEVTA